MTKDTFIYRICPVCGGDGVVTSTSAIPPYEMEDIECPKCLGPNALYPEVGGLIWGWTKKA